MRLSAIILTAVVLATSLACGGAQARTHRVAHARHASIQSHANRARHVVRARRGATRMAYLGTTLRRHRHEAYRRLARGAYHARRHVALGRAYGRRLTSSVMGSPTYADRSPVIRIAMRYLNSRNPTGARGPWCGDFQNLIERKAGHPGIASRMAPAWARYGHRTGPVPGAIAVFRGHVGTVVERIGNRIKLISGNYGHKVGIGFYDIRSAIAFRTY